MNGVINVPMATSIIPMNKTRPGADWVRKGAGKRLRLTPPQLSKSKRQADAANPKPVEVLSALKNKPMVWRVPIVSANVAAAPPRTSQTASGLWGKFIFLSDMVDSGFGCREQSQGFL